MEHFEFVIVGAGCAGLAVGRELANACYSEKVLIIDEKQQFDNDKSWSFWATDTSPWFQLAPYHWQYSSLSSGDQQELLNYSEHRYCMLPALDYYRYCVDQLTDNIELRLNNAVNQITCDLSEQCYPYKITLANNSSIAAKHLLDTRPQYQQMRYFQQFTGIEVIVEEAVVCPETVRLMEDMQCVDGGMIFYYVLPLSANHLLIEPTYFGNQRQDFTQLKTLAFTWLEKNGLTCKKILRTEQGILPMGGVTRQKVAYDLGGISGDQLKRGSGYGFVNIQQWSFAYVNNYINQNFTAKTLRQKILTGMDDLFIDVLIAKPDLAPQLMLATAMALPNDKFAKFMTEQSNWLELVELICKFPKSPFLKALYARLF
jgi:lycopene beta-cyclase